MSRKNGEVKPSEVAVEILGGDPTMTAQESLEPLVAAVDGLNMQFTPDTLTGGLVEAFMADAHCRRARRITSALVTSSTGVGNFSINRRLSCFKTVTTVSKSGHPGSWHRNYATII